MLKVPFRSLGSMLINMRQFSISPLRLLKEIVETKENKTITIEGKYIDPPWTPKLLKVAVESNSACPVCSLNLEIKHTDVLILSQFVRSDGCMLPRRITGLCKLQQKRIKTMVTMAQKAGLMANLAPATSKQNPKLRPKWKKCNTYYDESTIRVPKEYAKKKTKIQLF